MSPRFGGPTIEGDYHWADINGRSSVINAAPANRSEWADTFHTFKAGINNHFNLGGPVVARY